MAMATTHLPATILRPPTRRRHLTTAATSSFTSSPNYSQKTKFLAYRISECKNPKCAVRLRSIAQEESPTETSAAATDVGRRLVDFLYEDLPHLFDDRGIDRTAYDERVKFRDPITKHDTVSGYLFNIAMLRKLFSPDFQLHWVKQTGPYEITTRWTMVMKFILLPWKPELVFTGTSVMGVNPETMKFCSHVDFWDSIENNDYFSVEGLLDVLKQLRFYKTPDLESPKYQILKRTANYEVCSLLFFFIITFVGTLFAVKINRCPIRTVTSQKKW
ncbi:SOUL heme-binding family protein [Striga hermonthica]|uniref:SOUL heme-binding family protein n=1 Tax=Striga hermonthica TaxID=68872 RepID=A0A9N7NBG3_STRHE|nr:SOUL heme-binding family protein [Striga hermonthica]